MSNFCFVLKIDPLVDGVHILDILCHSGISLIRKITNEICYTHIS